MKKRQAFFDRLLPGFVIGIIFPIIVFYIYYLLKYNEIEFKQYLESLHRYGLLFKIMSLCVLTDLPVFYIFIHFKQYKGARGMVMACFIFAFAVLAYRIIT
ncbi:MAG: hypothetical protein JW798_05285 [Prolixibacteraceae bacterium]|nr:hypothetical protein [Prolixibacteraceae bacterium]